MRDAMGGETISGNGEPDTKEAGAFVDALNHAVWSAFPEDREARENFRMRIENTLLTLPRS